MACASPTKFHFPVVDLKDEDFFQLYQLKVQGILGEGMAGTVYLVKTRSSDSDKDLVAVKVFSLTGGNRDRSLRQFTTEAKTMQAVTHSHLVPCHGAIQCRDYLAIAMPYYSGGDLTDRELWRTADVQQIACYILHVAQAVERLHEHSIAHLDIKLDNVFIDGADQAVLGDPGLAKEMSCDQQTIEAELVGGTPDYWPPEMFTAYADDHIDPFKLDVYALGVIFYLYVAKEEPKTNVDYQSKLRALPDIHGMSPAQRSALLCMLEPDPMERPTACEVVQMLMK